METYLIKMKAASPAQVIKNNDVYELSNEKSRSEKRKNNLFLGKVNIKEQCFLQSYKYSDNKNIYLPCYLVPPAVVQQQATMFTPNLRDVYKFIKKY